MKHVSWEIKRMRTKVKILPLSNEYLKEAKQAFCEAITIAIGEHFEFLLQMCFKITYLKRRLTAYRKSDGFDTRLLRRLETAKGVGRSWRDLPGDGDARDGARGEGLTAGRQRMTERETGIWRGCGWARPPVLSCTGPRGTRPGAAGPSAPSGERAAARRPPSLVRAGELRRRPTGPKPGFACSV